MAPSRRCAAALAAATVVLAFPAASLADEARDALIVETVLRIEGFDLQGSTKAQAAVGRYLKSNWAGERYLDLIERFSLKEEAPGVLRLALEKSDTPMGAEAASLLVTLGAGNLLINTLRGEDDPKAVQAAVAISHAGAPALVAELPKILADQSRAVAVRSSALAALYGKHPAKQAELLATVKAGKLAKDLRQTASEILMLSRDPEIRKEAKSLFAVGEGNFPPVAELVKRKGIAANGKQLFATKTCLVCHQAGGVGINFGPGLSEIGDKLDKKALYQAILEPSAGISMGFEGWEVTLKDKSTLVGIVVETDENLTVTMIGGAKRTISKGEISTRTKLKQSLMYPGLHQLMTPGELVDLVEYLSSLRKGG